MKFQILYSTKMGTPCPGLGKENVEVVDLPAAVEHAKNNGKPQDCYTFSINDGKHACHYASHGMFLSSNPITKQKRKK